MSDKRKPDEPVGEMWSPEDAGEDAKPRTPLLERATSWKESDLRKFPTATLELIDALAAALRPVTPEPHTPLLKTGELESWVRLVPHVGHKEFKGSFESTTEFETFCVRCNLEKLTQGPTIRTPLNEWDKAKVRYAEAMLWYSYGRDPLKTNADWDKFRAERMAELHKELDRIEALAGPTIREVCEGRDDA